MSLRKTQGPRVRILSIVLLPVLLSALISTYLIHSVTTTRLQDQSNRYSQSICDYLAISVADHLINNDFLSLNVLLTELLKEQSFGFASVYDTRDELQAQAGKKISNSKIFTQQVTFQDSIAGYVQVGFDQQVIQTQIYEALTMSLALHGVLVLVLMLIGWLYSDLVYLWIMQPPKTTDVMDDIQEGNPSFNVIETSSTTILVVKVRPTRLLAAHYDRIEQALALYGGDIEFIGDDIVVCFDSSDQLFKAACSGLLILAIFRQSETPITIKAGMHQVIDRDVATDFEQARKHASYLASISENQLIASRPVQEIMSASDQYKLQPFHSSMAPDGEVFFIESLSNQTLIDGHAKQF